MLKRREFMGSGAFLAAAWAVGCESGASDGEGGAGDGDASDDAASGGTGGSTGASGGAPGSGGGLPEGGSAGAGSCGVVDTEIEAPHPHTVTITPAEVLLGASHYYTIAGDDHTHGLSLTSADFQALGQGLEVTKTSGEGGYGGDTHSHQVTVRCDG